ncbi:hypothetical protein [Kangiella sediminilitoris]|uniref:Uncharacterized protein n=1 Tax=Kangiella sediminilitoris TaxID=1144748 RepID=A0A1B3BDS2_9GAMM|nr:hypothetical protein [Kangiella sediminilitoris]AOE50962.1 hypothetical protein KS2013_2258 [Kangiella sediminilitoris]
MNTPILTALALALGLVGAVQSKDKRDFPTNFHLVTVPSPPQAITPILLYRQVDSFTLIIFPA